MDPLTISIISVAFNLGEKLLALVRMARKKLVRGRIRRTNNSHIHDLSYLHQCLLYLWSAHVFGLPSQPLKELLEELLSSVGHARIVLNPPHKRLASEEIQLHMEAFVSKFELHVARALMQEMLLRSDEIQGKFPKEVSAMKDIIVYDGKPTEEKMGAVITFLKKDDRVLTELHSFVEDVCSSVEDPAEAFQMLFDTDALIIDERLLQAPEVKEADGFIDMLAPEKTTTEGESDIAKQAKRHGNGVLCKPNRMLKIDAKEGEGSIQVSKCEGSQLWRVIYQGSSTEYVRVVTGESQMQVSKELGYHYYEVKLIEMVELQDSMGSISGDAGVGVGLAHQYKRNKVAGRYDKSYGYDGRKGVPLCEKQPCDFKVSSLVAGDTLGIGLFTKHEGSPFVFLTKNGVLQGAMPNLHLSKSSYNLLYPVISLASLHVKILVNFYGPFVLPPISDLLAAAKRASA